MTKRKSSSKNKLYAYMVFAIIAIFILLIYGISLLSNRNDTKSLLIDKKHDIVYTSYENKEYDKQVPAVNIKDISNDINVNINNFVEPYIDKMTNKIYYNYQINGNILSLIVILENYEIEGPADVRYMAYTIDLKELKVLSNEDIYNLFGFNEEYLLRVLDNNFKSYYKDAKNKKIFDSSISYEEYLRLHEITNFRDQIYCYIDNGKLNVYLDYNEWASNETEDYFVSIGHVFVVE